MRSKNSKREKKLKNQLQELINFPTEFLRILRKTNESVVQICVTDKKEKTMNAPISWIKLKQVCKKIASHVVNLLIIQALKDMACTFQI